MAIHCKNSPSASHRWMVCTASPSLIDELGIVSQPSQQAMIGTAVHSIIEQCLKDAKLSQWDFVGKTVEDIRVSKDMIEDATVALDYVRQLTASMDEYKLFSELYVDLSYMGISGFEGGTCDVAVISKDTLDIIDYKNGSCYVSEVCNPQLMIYAVGLIHKFNLTGGIVRLTIIQPNSYGEAVRTYQTLVADIDRWRSTVLIPKLHEIDNDPHFVPAEAVCKYCPAAGMCTALKTKLEHEAMMEFSNTLPAETSLTTEQKCKIIRYADDIRAFLDSVTASVKNEMIAGSTKYDNVLKLVRKNTKRRFIADVADPVMSPLTDYLTEEDIYEPKLKSISAIEKILKSKADKKTVQDIMSKVTEKPEGELEVALVDDKREKIEVQKNGC